MRVQADVHMSLDDAGSRGAAEVARGKTATQGEVSVAACANCDGGVGQATSDGAAGGKDGARAHRARLLARALCAYTYFNYVAFLFDRTWCASMVNSAEQFCHEAVLSAYRNELGACHYVAALDCRHLLSELELDGHDWLDANHLDTHFAWLVAVQTSPNFPAFMYNLSFKLFNCI